MISHKINLTLSLFPWRSIISSPSPLSDEVVSLKQSVTEELQRSIIVSIEIRRLRHPSSPSRSIVSVIRRLRRDPSSLSLSANDKRLRESRLKSQICWLLTTIDTALKAYTEMHDLNNGKKIHCDIVKAPDFDNIVLTGLVDMYAKCGEIESCCRVFDGIALRNVVFWTSMIAGYVKMA
ncbi:hypothetical protein Rs2_22733 [Raphanus sativus]|nr:hypothetical protein Rs2_22733 [Raphanus sativus]